MEITIKEPRKDAELRLTVEPEDYNGEAGWRVIYPDKDSFVMVQREGEWVVMDEDWINPELLEVIGKALATKDRYTSLSGS